MKRIFSIIALVFVYNFSFGAQANPTSSGGSSCTCAGSASVCSSSAYFMSCCICCQAGMSCGSWSGFGLCGCSCENVASGTLVVNPVAYEDFLAWCTTQQIPTTTLYNTLYAMISQDQIANMRNTHQPMFLDDNAVITFANNSRNVMNTFTPAQKQLINTYTNSN